MRYEKPMVMEVGGRPAVGQGIEACVTGPAAGNPGETCASGYVAAWNCVEGPTGDHNYTSCAPGTGANGDCVSGTAPAFWCGTGPGGFTDPYGCEAGPSFHL